MAAFLLVKGKNLKDSAVTDAWGFSDGKEMFVRHGYNFFPIYRCGEHFEFYGFEKINTIRPFPYGPDGARVPASQGLMQAGIAGLMNQIEVRDKKILLWVVDSESGKIINPLQSYYNSQQSP